MSVDLPELMFRLIRVRDVVVIENVCYMLLQITQKMDFKKTYGNFLDNFLGQYGLLKKFQSIFNKTICTQ